MASNPLTPDKSTLGDYSLPMPVRLESGPLSWATNSRTTTQPCRAANSGTWLNWFRVSWTRSRVLTRSKLQCGCSSLRLPFGCRFRRVLSKVRHRQLQDLVGAAPKRLVGRRCNYAITRGRISWKLPPNIERFWADQGHPTWPHEMEKLNKSRDNHHHPPKWDPFSGSPPAHGQAP